MKCAANVTFGLLMLAVLGSCSESPRITPTSPSTVPGPVVSGSVGSTLPPDLGRGTISIRELSPGAGATLAVKDGCPGGRIDRVCSETWQGTFEVVVDRDMADAVLTARFYDGPTLCAYGANTLDLVPAGNRVSFRMNRIYLSDEFGTFKSACRLPATTNRIEVELWSDHASWTNTLIQHFDNAYTFQP